MLAYVSNITYDKIRQCIQNHWCTSEFRSKLLLLNAFSTNIYKTKEMCPIWQQHKKRFAEKAMFVYMMHVYIWLNYLGSFNFLYVSQFQFLFQKWDMAYVCKWFQNVSVLLNVHITCASIGLTTKSSLYQKIISATSIHWYKTKFTL